jgi:hypothetical protein
MARPEVFYAVALCIVMAMEAGFRARGRDAFGPMAWVLGGNFIAAYLAYFSGVDLPAAQLILHCLCLVIGMGVARGVVGHLCASLFLPMSMVDVTHLLGLISGATWWWALFYMACAQLVLLGMGSNLHPLGRSIRRWSESVHQHFSRAVGAAR